MTKTNKFKLAAFFSGVGGIELGFEQTGAFDVVYANEFDKNACKTYALNHPDTILDSRDIHEVSSADIEGNIDIVVGGFPCQAFSIAGYRKGFEDERGDLFFELLRIIRDKRPRAVFIENVKNMVTHDQGNTFKVIREALTEQGYYIKWKVMNGTEYGNIPQNRERIYIVGFSNKSSFDAFEFPNPIPLTKKIRDIIDFSSDVDDYYYYTEHKNNFYEQLQQEMIDSNTIYQWRRQYVRENKSGVVPTLTANMGTGGHNVPLILTYDKRIRKLTPKETFNAQGFPEDFKLPNEVSRGQLYKQAGNSVIVPLIKRIARNIATALQSIITEDVVSIQGQYGILYINMNGRFEGESYLIGNCKTVDECLDNVSSFGKSHDVLSVEEYFKLVSKNVNKKFYMIVPLEIEEKG